MKVLITLLFMVFSVTIYAEKISCTTQFLNMRTDKNPKVKICGAVTLDKAFDNGIKYRKKPRFCNKFVVEFMSIRKGDEARFTSYCDKIFSKNCYVVRIHDNASHQGIGNLSSYIVFSSIKTMPSIFNLHAGGLGHNTSAIPRPGRLVNINLSCRKTP